MIVDGHFGRVIATCNFYNVSVYLLLKLFILGFWWQKYVYSDKSDRITCTLHQTKNLTSTCKLNFAIVFGESTRNEVRAWIFSLNSFSDNKDFKVSVDMYHEIFIKEILRLN